MVTQEELEKMSPEEISALQKQNCIFCKIISGAIPSKKIYEDKLILAILDIHPASKGHILVLPKEHYPILPLIPADTFKQMFIATKRLAKAVKKITLCSSVNIFVANGAVAGQQSPHFLFHLIPRDKNDKITCFDLKGNSEFLEPQKEIYGALKNNLNIKLSNHIKSEKIMFENKLPASEAKVITPKEIESKKEQISRMIDENEDVRTLLRQDVKKFKELIRQNDELHSLFEGVNIEQLSEKLKFIHEEEKRKNITLAEKVKPNVFLGENPLEQKRIVFEYFDKKPAAKDLLINDLEKFKELLSHRPDVQKIFENINLDNLSEKLKEANKNE